MEPTRDQRLFSRQTGAVLAIGTAAIFIPIALLTSQGYAAYAAAIQALGVLTAIMIAVKTLLADSRDRRVDRVLALHEQLTNGAVGDARRRLGLHLRSHGDSTNPVKRVSIADLRDDKDLSHYSPKFKGYDPFTDIELIARFFERCRVVQTSGSIDEPLFVELLGRHAAWWDKAILPDHTNYRLALAEFAEWARSFAISNAKQYTYLSNWGMTQLRFDFPSGAEEATPAERPTSGF